MLWLTRVQLSARVLLSGVGAKRTLYKGFFAQTLESKSESMSESKRVSTKPSINDFILNELFEYNLT